MVLTSPSDSESVPAALLLFGRVLGLDILYSICSFKLWLFLCAPGQANLLMAPQYHPSPWSLQHWG